MTHRVEKYYNIFQVRDVWGVLSFFLENGFDHIAAGENRSHDPKVHVLPSTPFVEVSAHRATGNVLTTSAYPKLSLTSWFSYVMELGHTWGSTPHTLRRMRVKIVLGSEDGEPPPPYPALRSAGLLAELRRHAQRVHELGLAGSEFPEELGDGTCFDASPKESIELLASCVHLRT